MKILVVGLLLVAYCLVLMTRRRSVRRLFLGSLFLVGAFLGLQPAAADRVAGLLGMERGTDVMLSFWMTYLLFALFGFYVRLKRYQTDLTAIASELALSRPLREHSPDD